MGRCQNQGGCLSAKLVRCYGAIHVSDGMRWVRRCGLFPRALGLALGGLLWYACTCGWMLGGLNLCCLIQVARRGCACACCCAFFFRSSCPSAPNQLDR